MNTRNGIISILGVLCAVAAINARGQTATNQMDETNFCKFILEVYVEGPAKTTNNETTFSVEKPVSFSDVDAMKEIDAVTGHSFSNSQRLARVGWNFWIMDQANAGNSYMVSNTIISGFYGNRMVKFGTRNNVDGLIEGRFEHLKLYTLQFNTSDFSIGHQYNFLLTGFEKKTITDGKVTNPTLGTFPQKETATVTKMSGHGHKGTLNVLLKGEFSERGSGIRQLGSGTGGTWGSTP